MTDRPSYEETLDPPQCGFHPNFQNVRCTNKAHFAIIGVGDESMWYAPICGDCLDQAQGLVKQHIVAHLFGYGSE